VRRIVFGSQARGEGGADSDLDLVVVEREVQDRFSEIACLHRVLRGLIMGVDILVIGEKDFEEWSATPGSVYHTARVEGKVLYEAA
jgi:predicted nucleotidyltransferase